jgi:hypothetical protein
MKTTNVHYLPFERVAGPDSDIGRVVVPEILSHASYNAFVYSQSVNNLVLCDLVDNDLRPNEARTSEERKKHIMRSPRVMAMNRSGRRGKKPRVFFRESKGLAHLTYVASQGETIAPWSDRDYVFRSQVAAEYLGISVDKFRDIIASGELGVYEGKFSHTQLRTGDPINRANIQAFLLHELNKFRK